MDPTPAEPPPGCLVLLLRLSAGMTAEVVTGRGETVAVAAVRQLADELIDALANTAAAGYALGPLDIAVLGYRTAEDGSPQLFSLLPDGDPKPRLVPISEVVEMPAVPRDTEGQPRKWTIVPGCEGEPCASAALASVYQLVSVWLTGRYTARPPVVVHCTATDGLDETYTRVARSLGLLTTGYGAVRLLHYVFEAESGERANAPRVSELEALSGELPENAEAGKSARRALSVNDWELTDLWDAVFVCSWTEDTVAWAESNGGFSHSRAMWAQKMGNTPEQWEDAFAVDAANGAAAVADGASTGIYCRAWADQLGRQFIAERPDTRDTFSLNKWVNDLRTEWRSAINYDTLNWSKKAKVDSVGAAATLLGLEVGPANADGSRPWRASAVGDASLFWVRDGQLVATFPVVAADQFGSAPLLVRSNPGYKTLAIAAAGTCQPGDRFVLATDAVSVRLFKSAANGPGPEWKRFETISEAVWRAELDTLRSANDMVNDDCTLVVLRVSGGIEEPEWVTEERQEEEVAVSSPLPVVERVARLSEPGEGPPVAESAESQPPTTPHPPLRGDLSPTGRGDQTAGEGDSASTFSEPDSTVSEPDEPPEEPPALIENFSITPDVVELVTESPTEPAEKPAAESTNEPVEPPPADEPPATRDGFPESTDPRV